MEEFCFSQASEEVMELATNFVDKYVDYIENLPFDLQRNVTRLREIDCTCREILAEIEALYGSFTKETDINLKKRATLIRIQRLFGRCQELGDEKISIVQQMSEAIESKKKVVEHASYRFTSAYRPDQKTDFNGKREQHKSYYNKASKRSRRHRQMHHDKEKSYLAENASTTAHSSVTNSSNSLRSNSGNGPSVGEKPKLDLVLSNPNKPSESSPKIKEEYTAPAKKSEKCEKKKQSPSSTSSNGNTTPASSTASASSQKASLSAKPPASKAPVSSSKASVAVTTSNNSNKNATKAKKKKKKLLKHRDDRASTRSPSPQVDIPIDPDEPTYCICDQVSFGQMIGCDNKKCPLEWFHFSCVGLTHKPKGKWYCPDCMRDMKDRKKDGKRDHR